MEKNKLIYDFEVFKHYWCVVIYDYDKKETYVIENSKEELQEFHNDHEDSIYIGYNNRYYDSIIFKGILLGLAPYDISDNLINSDERYFLPRNDIKMNNFDLVLLNRGLKELEGFMGSNIVECSIDWKLNRKPTTVEVESIIEYCKVDVMETVKVFEVLRQEYDSHLLMIETFNLDMSDFSKTKVRLSSKVLDAKAPKYPRSDEFDLIIPHTLNLQKYKDVENFYRNKDNMSYKKEMFTMVEGVPHIFAWGGIHGATPSYIGEGKFIMSDIASMYPATMINYDFISRNINDPSKYVKIRDDRIILKRNKDKRQLPMKIILNGTYGAMKDKHSDLYDPLMANNVCIAGQLLLLDLIEKVSPYCTLIQLI